ncbi:MAG TPA: amino acid permease [Vicinamibacterales bacterium]|jgi:amino acid transporter
MSDGSGSLPRTLGFWSSVAVVIGISIGSGIFRSPAGVAQLLPEPRLVLAVWTAGGLISLCGALSLAELAAALPRTGGIYAFLKEGWGQLAAFLFGWAELVLIRAAATGGIARAFGDYLLGTFGLDPAQHDTAARLVSAAAIAAAAAANIRGVNLAAAIVRVSTGIKVAALAFVVLASLALGAGHGAEFAHFTAAASGPTTAGAFGLALVGALWTYDGFADVSYVAGEVKDPQKTLPRAIVTGTVALIAIYLLANVAYLYVQPVEAIARSPLAAAATMQAIFGRAGASMVSAFVMVATFSSLNGITLASPRIFFAMASDGLLFGVLARVHPRYRTPYASILLTALLGIALVMSRSFEALTNTFVIAIWPFYALAVAALFRLRATRPDLERPYRVVGYPFVPALFVGAVIWFVGNALVTEPVSTSITLLLILAGVPVYLFTLRR